MLQSRWLLFVTAAALIAWPGRASRGDDQKAGTINAKSPDGKIIASANGKVVNFFDAATGKEIRRFAGHQDRVTAVAFSPDGKWLASGSADKTVRLWDIAGGKILWQLQVGAGVTSVTFSPDGKKVLTQDADKKTTTSDAGTGMIIKK